MGNNKYKILIVEDEANIRSFIKANLETSDYQVLCAETCVHFSFLRSAIQIKSRSFFND